MNIQHAQNIGPLAPLANASRAAQLAHIDEHIGNFEGIMMQQVPAHAQDPINTIIDHARVIHEQFSQDVHVHTNEAFNEAVHTALGHLNDAAGMIAQHQQQPGAAVPAVVPNDNVENNEGDDGNESDGTHVSDFSLNSEGTDHTQDLNVPHDDFANINVLELLDDHGGGQLDHAAVIAAIFPHHEEAPVEEPVAQGHEIGGNNPLHEPAHNPALGVNEGDLVLEDIE